ncbi:MAG TPA: polyprenyl diphosphate synthase [Bacillota bacterium]|nr:polyprenyl diphosphate synthase [Bacillota bacterium]
MTGARIDADVPVPAHVAIIMDGNGRWAAARGLERKEGHRAGASNIIKICRACQERGIATLSLFAFSTENWSRPKTEIDALFEIASDYFSGQFTDFPGMGIRLNVIGSRKDLPVALRAMITKAEKANPRAYSLTLNMAVNYGGKWDIMQSARKLAEKCIAGGMMPSDIDEAALEEGLSTSGQPPVDLLIRTSGEQRISNFLIWQCAYSELYFTAKHWPDFDETELDAALSEYARRTRKFGGLA